jgi:hypothetical protein
MQPKRLPILLLVAALVAGLPPVAEATTFKRMDLDELAAAASVIARVRCVAAESRWEAGHIWTFTTFEVVEPLKGAVQGRLTVRLVGGKVGHLISTVDGAPRFRPGEDAVLFLEPAQRGEMTVVSWAQGTFRIARDAAGRENVTQDTSGVGLFNAATRKFESGGVRHMPLTEFRQRVTEAVQRGNKAGK